MPLFRSIKKIFGLGEDYDLDESDSAEQFVEGGDEVPSPTAPAQTADDTEAPGDSSALTAEIFDSVVRLFNSTQPEFIKSCLDTEAQKTYILNGIDAAVRTRLEAEIENARTRGRNLWQKEREGLDSELATLRREKSALEQKREENKSQRLSAERQRRALTEKVRDLETQLLSIETEREQLQLMNRSMLNKLRVAEITGGSAGDDADATAEAIAGMNDRIEQLSSQLGTAEAERDFTAAGAAVKDEMIGSLLARIAAGASREKELAEALKAKEAEVAAARADAGEIARIKNEVNRVGSVIEKKNSRIAELKSQRQKDADTIAALNKETDSLRSRIAAADAANAELRESLEEARKEAADAAAKTRVRQGRQKPKPKTRISAIDEMIDGTDWLVSAPPPPVSEQPKEDDFGYKAPAKKPADDNQLSLW